MEITVRSLLTLIHGMGFGALYLLACSGALVELYRRYAPGSLRPIEIEDERFLGAYLVVMSVLAWITVLTGAYVSTPGIGRFRRRELRTWRLSAEAADGKPIDDWVALDRHGVEGACGLAGADLDHHGGGGFYPPRAQFDAPPATAERGAVFRGGFVFGCGHRGIFWRDAEQERASAGRADDSTGSRERSHERQIGVPRSIRAQGFPNGGGAAALLAAGIGSLMVAIFAILPTRSRRSRA